MNNKHPALALRLKPWRANFVLGLFGLALTGLLARAAWLASVDNEFLQAESQRRVQTAVDIPAHRGQIVDRNGAPLAVSVQMTSIAVDPRNVNINPQRRAELAKALEVPLERLDAQLDDRSRGFVYLRRQLTPEHARRVRELRIRGLVYESDFRRFYPAGEEAGHLVGFTGREGRRNDAGRAGVERVFDDALGGIDGRRFGLRDSGGRIVDDAGNMLPPRHGSDLTLAMDRELQYIAYRELKKAVTHHKASGGGIVMLDVRSGEVVAMANYPGYNPNSDERADPDRTRNRTAIDLFEPGSTMKAFTTAIALEEGVVKPDTPIEIGDGTFRIGKHVIRDTHPDARVMTVAQVMQKSSNVGSIRMALQTPRSRHWEYLRQFGFGSTPGTGFPGEVSGQLRPWQNWQPVDQVTLSYGHGVAVSLLQLARAYLPFARDGDIIPVSLLRTDTPPQGQRVVSPETARQVREMLESVTQPGGTATRAALPAYRTAGKTGTARKIRAEGGYHPNRYIGSFVGFAPVSQPRYLIAVMIDDPRSGGFYGGLVAAPVFGAVMGEALRLNGVPPDAAPPVWATRPRQPGADTLAQASAEPVGVNR